MSEIRTYLKSELAWNMTICVFGFQTHFWKNMHLKTELFGNQTVIECLKYILVQISVTSCIRFQWKNKQEKDTFWFWRFACDLADCGFLSFLARTSLCWADPPRLFSHWLTTAPPTISRPPPPPPRPLPFPIMCPPRPLTGCCWKWFGTDPKGWWWALAGTAMIPCRMTARMFSTWNRTREDF